MNTIYIPFPSKVTGCFITYSEDGTKYVWGIPKGEKMSQIPSLEYEEKLMEVTKHLLKKNGSFSASEVLTELKSRGWGSPLDSVLDIHAQLTELLGEPERKGKD